jgi:hypothetical protein
VWPERFGENGARQHVLIKRPVEDCREHLCFPRLGESPRGFHFYQGIGILQRSEQVTLSYAAKQAEAGYRRPATPRIARPV